MNFWGKWMNCLLSSLVTPGGGPIEDWALDGIQAEIRRRIMEGSAAIMVEPEPERIKVEIQSIVLKSMPEVRSPAQVTIYHVVLRSSVLSWKEQCVSVAELTKFLRGLETAASFGLPVEKIPDVP